MEIKILFFPYLKPKLKGIHWQLDKLGLKVVFCLDKNDGESHFAELGSCWPGEAKTWPKIALRVGGRAENSVLGDGRSYKSTVLRDGRPREKSTVLRDGRDLLPRYLLADPPVPQHSTFFLRPPIHQHGTFIAAPVPQHTIFRPSSNT